MSKVRNLFFNKGSSIAYAIISAVFTVVPEELFKHGFICCNWSEEMIVLVNRLLVCVFFFVVSNVFFYYHRQARKAVIIPERTYRIVVEIGDLFSFQSGKKVVDFDECFTTTVGNNPGDIKPDSVCGQYLKKSPIEDVGKLIADNHIKPTGKSQFMNKESYTPGTIIPRDGYLLMAFAKLDNDGLGKLTYNQFVDCLGLLWKQIDLYHGTDDVYIPILGSRIVRFDRELTQQELLDIIIASYRLSSHKIKFPNTLHIVCKERDGFSINNVFGVD